VVVFYKIEDHPMEDLQSYELYQNMLEHIDKSMKRFYEELSTPLESKTEQEQLEIYKTFMKQMASLEDSELKENQAALFAAIEQTDLFYVHSMLYRVKNCSIFDFIKSDPAKMAVFKAARKRDLDLFTELNQEKKKIKGSPEVLRLKEKEIDCNLLAFFKEINPDKCLEIKNINDQSCRVTFLFAIREKEKKPFEELIGQMSVEGNAELKRPRCDLEFNV
jgi:hypothetical protein